MRLNAYRQEKVRGEMTAPAILTEETLGLLSLGRTLFREPFDPHRNQSNLQPRGQAGKAPMREVIASLTHLPCLSTLPPVTRHPGLPPATRSFVSHFFTFARGEAVFAPLHGFLTSPCPRAYALYPLSTCQLANRPANLSRSCQPAHWSTDQLNITLVWFSDPKVRPDPVFVPSSLFLAGLDDGFQFNYTSRPLLNIGRGNLLLQLSKALAGEIYGTKSVICSRGDGKVIQSVGFG